MKHFMMTLINKRIYVKSETVNLCLLYPIWSQITRPRSASAILFWSYYLALSYSIYFQLIDRRNVVELK